MQMTKAQILTILKNNLIDKCTKEQKKQVMAYAFGEEFIVSKDKGSLKEYRTKQEKEIQCK